MWGPHPAQMQLLYWHHLTGDFIFNAYDADPRLELAHPHLIDVAFSVRKGLLFWTPLVGLGVAGLFVLRGRARGLLLPTAVFLAASFWFMASWSDWWYGGSFGQRAFVESLPPLAIGIAALFAWARAGRALVPVGIAALVTSCTSAFSRTSSTERSGVTPGKVWQNFSTFAASESYT